jgi:hypothetical protein
MLHITEASLRAVETVLDAGARNILARCFGPVSGRTSPLFPIGLTNRRLAGRGLRRMPSRRLPLAHMSRTAFVRLVLAWSMSVVGLLIVVLAVRWFA